VNAQIRRDRDRHTSQRLFNALREGRTEALDALLTHHPDKVNALDGGGRTPLLVAAGGGHTDCVELLLEKGANLEATSLAGETAVHAAAGAGALDMIELLLGLGCSLTVPDRSGTTPLGIAAANGKIAAVKLLLANGATAEMEDVCGRTPLFRATAMGSLDVMEALLESPTTDIEARDAEGATSLMAAAGAGNPAALNVLLQHGADLDTIDVRGRTPLIRAAMTDAAETARMLLELGVAVDSRDTHGATAAWHACAENSGDALDVLIQHGCDLQLADTRYLQSPIDTAFEHGARACIDVLRGVPGLELPELPDDMMHHHHGSSALVARRGYELVPSSLNELERMVHETQQIFPRRIEATFEGEEAYGEGPTRQWVAQLGRELLQTCNERVDWPSKFNLSVEEVAGDGGAAAAATTPAIVLKLAPFGEEDVAEDEANSIAPTIIRGRECTLHMRKTDFDEHPLALFADIDCATAVREDRVAMDVVIDPQSGTAIITLLPDRDLCPDTLYMASYPASAGKFRFKPTKVTVHDGHFCRVHGPCHRERCSLVTTSDLVPADDAKGTLYHTVSLSPVSDPEHNRVAALHLRGLGRALGIAICMGCPVGIALSPAFCKLLQMEYDSICWQDLQAVMPERQFALLQQCLDESLSAEDRRAHVDLWKDATGHETFVTESVHSMRVAAGVAAAADVGGVDDVHRTVSGVTPDGVDREITVESMREYADTLAVKILVTNVAKQAQAVRQGVRDVRNAIRKLSDMSGWRELQSTLLGSINIDVDEWRANVLSGRDRGRGGDSATADRFWRAVGRLSAEDRRKLLFFWTAESPPAGGLKYLDRKMTLRVDSEMPPDRPRAATCFYSLDIGPLETEAEADKLVQVCVAHWNSWGQE